MKTYEWCNDCKEYDNVKKCCPRFNHVISEALKDAEQRWIPVSERLPENDKEVLVTLFGGSVDIGWFDNDKDEGLVFRTEYCRFDEDEIFHMVNAWMPLPEPWKGEEE